ncbi:hypothetical protein [Alkalicoccobacillus gibsonii]|uniref:hypothetical protein n=1 Tax=Alkalicoccobacillus gibsonii TaxID=79881 RepID=UPI0019339610|nr:hypothetical protein [Alkalicoccobacillus gibsonii]MBM0065912.1 hypothetical protein [Alkalicoccobacillus gibsonii]
MADTFKSFFFTFILAPSILGAGAALTYEILPFLWSLITFNEFGLAFKNVGISFLVGYVMYFIYLAYKAASYKLSKMKSD